MTIRILPPAIASRIAAGEVIERPASAVKELIENSLDAGAGRIAVEIGGGGLSYIRVVDDGHGVAADELALAFQRHATSKLPDDADLSAVLTLGFRGEALPSIAAVAEVEATSRQVESEAGAYCRLRAGEIVEAGVRGAPEGTSIAVQGLFRRQPARLKFLRSPAAEASQIAAVVTHYALAYPEVRFSLSADGRETFTTSGSGDRREAAAGVYGPAVAGALLAAEEASEGHRVAGLIAPPSISRANRSYVTIFVNRRWVRSRSLTFAVEEAYRGLLPLGRFPVAIVDVRVPPEEVDVNVHPAKAEVRLRDERAVFALIQRPLRRVLAALGPRAWLGTGALAGSGLNAWSAQVAYSPLRSDPGAPDGAADAGWYPGRETGTWHEGADYPGLKPGAWDEQRIDPEAEALDLRHPSLEVALPRSAQPAEAPDLAHQPALPARLPVLRPLGQAGTTYLIAEGPAGLYLIDQHAAHERVMFERIRAERAARKPTSQGLLSPLALELTPAQASLVAELGDTLSDFGFEVERFGPGPSTALRTGPSTALRTGPSTALRTGFLLRAAPAHLRRDDPARAFGEFVDLLTREDGPADPEGRLAASLACHAAVRAGQTLSFDEMRELVRQLEECDLPQTCPHGRPTIVHISAAELARRFGRS